MMNRSRSGRTATGLRLLLVCLFMAVGTGSLYAQSTSQVNIVGIPSVLPSPFADDIENSFRTGQYQVIFNFSSFDSQPETFIFEFTLRKDNDRVVELESVPMTFNPGTHVFTSFFEEIDFPETPNDVLNQLDSRLRNQVVQSGSVPEGNYSMEISARPADTGSRISVMPGNANFSVRYPSPPRLASVPDESNVMIDTPTFTWTPVVSGTGTMFEYDFLLVEVRDGQSPLQAINSNREHAFETVTGQTVLPYTLEFLPLEEGATYAWQVTARDINGEVPVRNDGESEIYTFTYRDMDAADETLEEIADLDLLTLVPGFATADRFNDLEVQETNNSYIISGRATLNLDFLNHGSHELTAILDRVEIQKQGSLSNPVLMGGRIEARPEGLDMLGGPIEDLVSLNSVEWEFGTGVTASLDVDLPGGDSAEADGMMMLDPTGLRGDVSVIGDPLASASAGPVEAALTAVSVQFPAAQMRGESSVRLMGEELCDTPDFAMNDGNFRLSINCDTERTIPMVEDSDLLVLSIDRVNGQLSGSLSDGDLDFAMAIRSSLDFLISEDRYCGGRTTLSLTSEDGVETEGFSPTCSVPRPSIDLGFMHATLNNIELDDFSMNGDGEGFDFGVNFDTQLFFPSNPDLSLPGIEGISISPDGITFPEVSFSRPDLPVNNTFSLGSFELSLEQFRLDSFTFPWFDWGGDDAGPWSFSFDTDVGLPFASGLPGCLSDTDMMIEDASVTDDGDGNRGLSGALIASANDSCSWDIGPGITLQIDQIGGNAVMERADDDFDFRSDLILDATLDADGPFACEEGESISLDNLNISLKEGLNGNVSGVVPACPLQVGPYEVEITQSDLQFSYSDTDGQSVLLDGSAMLQIGPDKSAEGLFTLDLTTGEFSDLDFAIDGPFEWGIPAEDPVLVFTVDEAAVSGDGLFIDGRQELELDGESIGATFDELLIDRETFGILEGRIIFDQAFSFAAGIDTDQNSIQFQSSTQDSTLELSPGVLMELAGQIQADSTGIRSSGFASAEMEIDGLDPGTLEVEYSDDFALGLDPMAIVDGQVDFYWDSQRVAYADDSGFHPNLSFFTDEFLPDRIPLPHSSVAYLQIRDEETEELVVSTQRQDKGTFLIETIDGQQLDLVLPVIRSADESEDPVVSVQLNDLVVNSSDGSYVSGSVVADTDGVTALGDRPDLPLAPEEIQFTTGESESGQEIDALFLSGSLRLFDEVLGDEQQVSFYAQSDGLIRGAVVMPEMDTNISLDGPGGQVVFSADSLAGIYEWNPSAPDQSVYDLELKADFQVLDFDDEPVISTNLELALDNYGLSVNRISQSESEESVGIDFSTFELELPGINNLSLNYTRTDGFTYHAELDLNLHFRIGDTTVPFPLNQAEIQSGTGIVIPEQDIHDGSSTGLDLPAAEFGIFRAEPIALRMDRDTLAINDFSPGDLLNLTPVIDLDLSMPGMSNRAPALAELNLTLQDVTWADGSLQGEMIPMDLSDLDLEIPLPGGASMTLQEIRGEISGEEGDETGEDTESEILLDIDTDFDLPDRFALSEGTCDPAAITLELGRSGFFDGEITGFEPCGEIAFGPFSLSFGETSLIFDEDEDGSQAARIEGNATVAGETEDGPGFSSDGFLAFDILNQRVLDGSISIDTTFPWQFPYEDPLFNFTTESAVLNEDGFVLDASGTLDISDGASVGIDFDGLTFGFSQMAVIDGSMSFDSDIALEAGLSPLSWNVQDPAADTALDNGVRMVIPQGISISHDGMLVEGEAAASLYFGEEEFTSISVDFVEALFQFDPSPLISEGRADFLYEETEGEEPVRLAWMDDDGFHPDNIAAALSIPDTLALPSEDIAYIVLRDSDGNNLVQSENTPDGLSIYTTDPVDLVLTAFDREGEDPYIVSVEFDDLVIGSDMNVASGSVIADLTETPLNLKEETAIPAGITRLEFRRESGSYRMLADAHLQLPDALQELRVAVEDLMLDSDGFSETTVSLGQYTESYDEDNDEVLAEQSFAGDELEMTVRGAELSFGGDQEFRISGEMASSLFRDEDDERRIIHLSAAYDDDWDFTLDTAHLATGVLPVGMAELVIDDLGTEITHDHFAMVLDTRLRLPDLLGDDTELGIEGLSVGTNGVSIDGVTTGDEEDEEQPVSLFGQQDNLLLDSISLELTDDLHLLASLSGTFTFIERQFDIEELMIGTDGTFVLGDGDVDLIGDDPVEVLGSNLVLQTLEFSVDDGTVMLASTAGFRLPDPVETDSEISISVTHQGDVSISEPDITLDEVGHEIPGVGEVTLRDAGFEVGSFTDLDFAIYAMFDIESGGENIRLGEAGNTEEWGIRYEYGGSLQWNITNAPQFEFENEMFEFAADAIQMDEESDQFALQLGVNAELGLSGISGSIGFDGMIISTGGIEELGTFSEANLDVGPASLSLEEFEYEANGGTLSIEREEAGSSEESPGVETEEIQTDRHLVFGGDMTIPGGFEGGADEILFYQKEGETYLSVKNFNATFSDLASINASMHYASLGGGEFELMVAGAAEISPPGSDSGTGLAAAGSMAYVDDEFSFGIFVMADAEVPVFPGILTLTSFGGGFFYNADASDFENVLDISGHELGYENTPWVEESGSYDFAVIAYAGAGIVGQGGSYAINGSAILMMTEQWVAFDMTGGLFSDGDDSTVEMGLYVSVQWDPSFQLTGAAFAEIDNFLVGGSFELDLVVIRQDGETVWGIDAQIQDLNVMRFFSMDGQFIAGSNGFYFDIKVVYEFSIKIIRGDASFELAVWWVRGEQFGAYAEVSVDVRMFKRTFRASGTLRGGLLVESDSYLVYAHATFEVRVTLFSGTTGVELIVENGSYSGGRGSTSEYLHRIRGAQREAQQMNDDLTAAIDAVSNLSDIVEDQSHDPEDIADAGEQILGSDVYRKVTYFFMLLKESELTGDAPETFDAITEVMMGIDSIPSRSDYDIFNQESDLNNAIDDLMSTLDDISAELEAIELESLELLEETEEAVEGIVSSPVREARMEWTGDDDLPPDFDIDANQDARNQEALSEIREEMARIEDDFDGAVNVVTGNIAQLEETLVEGGEIFHDVTIQFHAVLEKMDHLYSSLGAMYWDIRDWAVQNLNLFQDSDTDLERSVMIQAETMLAEENMVFSFEDENLVDTGLDYFEETNYELLAEITATRSAMLLMNVDDSDGFNSEKQDEYQSLINTVEGVDEEQARWAQFAHTFVNRAIEFWYEMPVLGYDALEESAINSVPPVFDLYEVNAGPMEEAYADYTDRMDDIYSSLHSMHANLEEILRQYIDWHEDVYDNSETEELMQYKLALQEKASIPEMGFINVSSTLNGYIGEMNVNWNATHPEGEILDNSYFIQYDGSDALFGDRFLSIGNNSEFRRYHFKKEQLEPNRDLTIQVRSRGPSGLGATRTRSYSLNVRPAPETDHGISFNLPSLDSDLQVLGTSPLIGETDPPEPPVLSLPYRSETVYYSEQVSGNIATGGPAVDFEESEYEHYWTNDPTQLVFTASSFDQNNVISGFEFKIGTSPNDSTVMGWTDQMGTMVSGSADEQIYTVESLSLEEGTEYFITVRALNSQGEKSDKSVIGPIEVNLDAPTAPDRRVNDYSTQQHQKPDEPTFRDAVYGPLGSSLMLPRSIDEAEPLLRPQYFPGNQVGSPVYRHRVVYGEESDPDLAADTGYITYRYPDDGIFEIEGYPLKPGRTFYFHIYAEDKAGNLSEPLTLDPVEIKDPTAAYPAEIAARSVENQLGFYMVQRAQDPETGIAGYRYELINDDTGQQIPDAEGYFRLGSQGIILEDELTFIGDEDYEESGPRLRTSRSGGPTFYELPSDDLPEGVPIRVRVVALNGTGDESHPAESGPVYLDSAPPEEPVVTVINRDGTYDITVEDAHDPDSGIISLEYRVAPNIQISETIQAQFPGMGEPEWTELREIDGVRFSPLTAETEHTVQTGDLISSDDYIVYVRIRNSSGLDRVVSASPQDPAPPFGGLQNINVQSSFVDF